MAASFPRDARILRFNPRSPQGYKGRRRELLWPVLAYRVGVPVSPRPERMDLFQRAVFGLLLHGINDNEQIASTLNLHPNLIGIVKEFLVEHGLIDRDDIVKVDAERRYREARFDLGQRPDEFTTGYVFQEAFTGLLLPRLVETLETADFTVREDGFPELRRGERSFRPFVEFAPSERQHIPSAAEILTAFEGSRKARRGRWELDDDDESGTGPKFLSRVKRVNFIDQEPELMYLSTFIFGSGLTSWEVADPFGLPTSPLTALAHKRLIKSAHLRRFVQQLDEHGSEDTVTARNPVEEALESLQHEFGTEVDDHSLLQALLDVELAVSEFRAAPADQRQRRARQTLGAIRLLVEHLLRDIRLRYSAAGVEKQLLEQDAVYNFRRIEGAAQALSFEIPLPPTLTSVKRGDVYWMANRDGSGKLRPLLIALLLSAVSLPDHPFHTVAKMAPNFLQQFDELLGWCGEAVHVSAEPPSIQSWVEPALERAYQTVKLVSTHTVSDHPAVPSLRVAPEPQELEFDELDL